MSQPMLPKIRPMSIVFPDAIDDANREGLEAMLAVHNEDARTFDALNGSVDAESGRMERAVILLAPYASNDLVHPDISFRCGRVVHDANSRTESGQGGYDFNRWEFLSSPAIMEGGTPFSQDITRIALELGCTVFSRLDGAQSE